MNNIMLDLETMGTKPNAAIIAIGAVRFDLESRIICDTFYEVVNLESSVKEGGTMDASTVLWWNKQSEQARTILSCSKNKTIVSALILFDMWIRKSNISSVNVWGNGSDFDNVILQSAYERINHTLPWCVKNNRCYRTVKALKPSVKIERIGIHHNALDDAMSQVKHLFSVLDAISKKQVDNLI